MRWRAPHIDADERDGKARQYEPYQHRASPFAKRTPAAGWRRSRFTSAPTFAARVVHQGANDARAARANIPRLPTRASAENSGIGTSPATERLRLSSTSPQSHRATFSRRWPRRRPAARASWRRDEDAMRGDVMNTRTRSLGRGYLRSRAGGVAGGNHPRARQHRHDSPSPAALGAGRPA